MTDTGAGGILISELSGARVGRAGRILGGLSSTGIVPVT